MLLYVVHYNATYVTGLEYPCSNVKLDTVHSTPIILQLCYLQETVACKDATCILRLEVGLYNNPLSISRRFPWKRAFA